MIRSKAVFSLLGLIIFASVAVKVQADTASYNLTTSSDETDRSTYTTASITPTSNRLILLGVSSGIAGVSDQANVCPTITGNSLTWVQVTSVYSGAGSWRLCLYRALASSPTSGTVSIAFDGSRARAGWTVSEYDQVPTTGTNGSDAVKQYASNTANSGGSLTVTLGAFDNALNSTYGLLMKNDRANAVTSGTGFTDYNYADDGTAVITGYEFKDFNDTGVDWSWSGSAYSLGIAIEIVNYVAPTPTPTTAPTPTQPPTQYIDIASGSAISNGISDYLKVNYVFMVIILASSAYLIASTFYKR